MATGSNCFQSYCSQRLGVQPVQPPEVPEYSAGSGPGPDPVQARFRPVQVFRVFSVFSRVFSVFSVFNMFSVFSVFSGSCRQTAQLDNSSPYIRADWRYAIRIERTEDLKRVVQGRMRMRSTLLQLQT